jgi:hypothetical protein
VVGGVAPEGRHWQVRYRQKRRGKHEVMTKLGNILGDMAARPENEGSVLYEKVSIPPGGEGHS